MWSNLVVYLLLCAIIYILKKITDPTHNKPNKIKFYFNFVIYYFATILSSTLILPICCIRPKNVLNAKIGAQIITFITHIFIKDLKWNLRNGEILAVERGAVIIANHQSTFDILGMFNVWDTVNKMAAVAKKELFYVWPFGLSAYLAGVVFINRCNAKNTYRQFEETTQVMIQNKTKIWIFPEGTRNRSNRKMLPFKKGAFNIAVAAQVPIIPVVYSPYYFINADKHIFNKGRVIIQCLEPVPTVGLTVDDVPELATRLHQIMSDAYEKLSKEVLDALPSEYYDTIKYKNI